MKQRFLRCYEDGGTRNCYVVSYVQRRFHTNYLHYLHIVFGGITISSLKCNNADYEDLERGNIPFMHCREMETHVGLRKSQSNMEEEYHKNHTGSQKFVPTKSRILYLISHIYIILGVCWTLKKKKN